MSKAPGNLYVVAAPSGTGKTTLVDAVVRSLPDVTVSVSHTTRPKRPAETEGLSYYFVDEKEFQRMVDNQEFLEHALVFNNHYGTSRKWVEKKLTEGMDVILEIDWQGSQQIHHLFTDSITIFILPPSRNALAERLLARNQDKPEIIQQRLADVRESTSHIYEFDYVVMNDDFDKAVHDLKSIIEVGRLSRERQTINYAPLLKELRSLDL